MPCSITGPTWKKRFQTPYNGGGPCESRAFCFLVAQGKYICCQSYREVKLRPFSSPYSKNEPNKALILLPFPVGNKYICFPFQKTD